MTIPTQETSGQEPIKNEAIETNLAKQRQMYERKLEQERQARMELEARIAAAEAAAQQRERMSPVNEEEEDSEPYVDKKKLHKELHKFQKNIEETIDKKAEAKAAAMIETERRTGYLRENPDFNQVMNEETIEKFANKHPRLAEGILRMPEGFERQKLVYETIKTLGMDKPEEKQPSIQDKIDANRRNPYYQPSGVGSAPYASAGDFSSSGQKNAYAKMQELKNRLRLG